ncbi:MAG: hypothetical protein IID61_05525 [SAR324 cluster bacterium]|nr:hypothetical protein [SAR324 cluster bacterium]
MARIARLILLLLLPLTLLAVTEQPAFAQAVMREKPVMENVFFNVFWGSATGALLGAALSSIAADQKDKPTQLRESIVQGATFGGVAGLAAGIWLLFNGITFDPDRSLFFRGAGPVVQADSGPPIFTPPIVFLAEGKNPNRITGFKALVLDLKF